MQQVKCKQQKRQFHSKLLNTVKLIPGGHLHHKMNSCREIHLTVKHTCINLGLMKKRWNLAEQNDFSSILSYTSCILK